MPKHFAETEHQDFVIKDDNGLFGRLRIKPGSILWKDKSEQIWHKVTIEKFSDFANKNGVLAKK